MVNVTHVFFQPPLVESLPLRHRKGHVLFTDFSPNLCPWTTAFCSNSVRDTHTQIATCAVMSCRRKVSQNKQTVWERRRISDKSGRANSRCKGPGAQ